MPVLKTQFQLELRTCRARQTMELKTKHAGMGREGKHPYLKELSPWRGNWSWILTQWIPGEAHDFPPYPPKSNTRSAVEHHGTQNSGRCVSKLSITFLPCLLFYCHHTPSGELRWGKLIMKMPSHALKNSLPTQVFACTSATNFRMVLAAHESCCTLWSAVLGPGTDGHL